MVRLVFRPYTQVRRSICTLESLRTSTRVSPGFALLRHSSPSFGSQHVCSHSNLSLVESWSVDSAASQPPTSALDAFTLISRWGFKSRALAHMLDSLVRVSRRVDEIAFCQSHSFVRQGHQTESALMPFPLQRNKPDLDIVKDYDFHHCFPSVPFQQFQVLFHSLFKVLFIFPSRYLFAIGLPSIFSFRWNLPPI